MYTNKVQGSLRVAEPTQARFKATCHTVRNLYVVKLIIIVLIMLMLMIIIMKMIIIIINTTSDNIIAAPLYGAFLSPM